ncbi:type I restriction enzyme R protein [Helicobacter pylori B8]|uniref:Type I restriction enzyme R protein n=1 Tax=Helicobacter pylori (strain B8) TaxID=693745 RepID=D7FES0_HELP3|nr:type I restriction enzyme R protein [Helicobacter pylori B8]
MPYDEKNPDQGAFYSASYSPIFQRFVEAHKLDITPPPKIIKTIKTTNRLKKFKKAS